jgi:VWFA-related protein
MKSVVAVGILAFVFLAAVPVVASSESTPRFTDAVEVRLIDLEVHVTDRGGNRVRGLTSRDFEVLENGVPQEITNFTEYQGDRLGGTATQDGSFELSPEPSPQPRTILLFLDHLPLTPPDRRVLFEQLRSFSRDALRDGDRTSVVQWRGSLTTLVPLTEDHGSLERELESLANRPLPSEASPGLDEHTNFHRGAQSFLEEILSGMSDQPVRIPEGDPLHASVQIRASWEDCARRFHGEMRRKTAVMESLIASLAGVEGRKLFVYVSAFFPSNSGTFCEASRRASLLESEEAIYSTQPLVKRATDAANAAGVVFYVLRPRPPHSPAGSAEKLYAIADPGVSGMEAAAVQIDFFNDVTALARLADETGGLLGTDRAIRDILPRIVSDLDSYYSIAYRTTSDGRDRVRRIDVRARDPQLQVRARRSLVDRSPRTRARDQLIANLLHEPDGGELDVELVMNEPRESGRRLYRPIELRIPLEQLRFSDREGTDVARFTVMTAGGSALGDVGEPRFDTREVSRPEISERGTYVTYELEVLFDESGNRASIGVLDEGSGIASFHLIDRDGNVLTSPLRRSPFEAWSRFLDDRRSSGKPLLVYFPTASCAGESAAACASFENETLRHPEIARLLTRVDLHHWTSDAAVPGTAWPSTRPGVALLRKDGAAIGRWALPEAALMAQILDRSAEMRAAIAEANRRAIAGDQEDADLLTAWLAASLSLPDQARLILERLKAGEDPRSRTIAEVRLAFLDAIERTPGALEELVRLGADAPSSEGRVEAWLAVASIRLAELNTERRIEALEKVIENAERGSDAWSFAMGALQRLRERVDPDAAIRIVPPAESVLSGRVEFRTVVSTPEVTEVEFRLDGEVVEIDRHAPFRATVDLGRIPRPRSFEVVARDESGEVAGTDRIELNGRRDSFWVRLASPDPGALSGRAEVRVELQIPSSRRLDRIEVGLGDEAPRRVEGPPFVSIMEIPQEPSFINAVAHLDDGSRAEDTVILNASGLVAESSVHMVEVPVMLSQAAVLDGADLLVSEEGVRKLVQRVIGPGDAPLTVGLLIDTSSSMWERMLEVQLAATTFLDQVLGPRDAGFVISFDSAARLVQEPTRDRNLLKARIRELRPRGLTLMNDAMMLGLLQFEAIRGRRALVIFSDGIDKGSRHDLDQVKELSRRAAVPIYLIRAEPAVLPRTTQEERWARQRFDRQLVRLIEESGGRSFLLSGQEELGGAYGAIAEDIGRQILVAYTTEIRRGRSEWRRLEISATKPGLELRSPAGYLVGLH